MITYSNHINFSVQKSSMRQKLIMQCLLIFTALFFTNTVLADSEHAEKDHDEHHEEHADSVELNPEQLKTAGITLEQVQAAMVHERLPVYGSVALNSEKTQRVSARFKGVVRSVSKKVGDNVRAGEVLASIESDESLKTYTLNSTLDGVVLERSINPGEQTDDKTAFVIADLASVWVELALFPSDLAKVKKGQTVRIINPHTQNTALGELNYLSLNANAVNQTATGRVLLTNAGQQWLPGLFVQADILLAEQSAVLAVRSSALQEHEGKQVVFVQEEGAFKPRAVRIGRSDGLWTEILAGLHSGETYVAHNSFVIKAELGKDGAAHDH